ncbi:cupin domain-containing protein [Leptospira ognonensis]|uniref:Cupin domain-containing protein n=1 Tax=Leptospira ognonensis TaxID=2484945 RepID=A0A4R9K351_9LEPT|nr:cupin domain-containing protein [Leptospira ognonensis]TGL59294.1 cupin domain-containing protein [Leptospira ognonensis]
MSYHHQTKPISIPVPGGKTIQEHFGIPSSGNREISIAHMIAPSGWGEPFQTPDFDEFTLMVRGEKKIEIEDKVVILRAGESIKIDRGTRVRYSNPFSADAEYWSICTPAFSLDAVKREEEKL